MRERREALGEAIKRPAQKGSRRSYKPINLPLINYSFTASVLAEADGEEETNRFGAGVV